MADDLLNNDPFLNALYSLHYVEYHGFWLRLDTRGEIFNLHIKEFRELDQFHGIRGGLSIFPLTDSLTGDIQPLCQIRLRDAVFLTEG